MTSRTYARIYNQELQTDQRAYQQGLVQDDRAYQKGLTEDQRAYQKLLTEDERAYQGELIDGERAYQTENREDNQAFTAEQAEIQRKFTTDQIDKEWERQQAIEDKAELRQSQLDIRYLVEDIIGNQLAQMVPDGSDVNAGHISALLSKLNQYQSKMSTEDYNYLRTLIQSMQTK